MPKWIEYTSKDTLADNDEVMLYDATGKANKRGLMSKFWDYVVDKMATAVISKLETDNKTIIGAINALNGKISTSHYTYNPEKKFETTIQNNKIALIFTSSLGNSNIYSTGLGVVIARTGDSYTGKYTEILPTSNTSISLDGNKIKINSTIWLIINIIIL